ncbi:MAG: hypothetical protein HY062_00255 [Bacteroidetes bacterium]|nr:hypothetical protein [Bacteroidota bacterium]
MKQLFFLASLVSLACLSCKSKKDVTKTSEATKTETTASADAPANYRLVISFISKGGGPDHKKQEALLAYVNGHPKKPAYKTVLWGREGENDFCFTLSELTKSEVTTFINEVKKIADGSDMMKIIENMPSEHQGR